MDIVSLGKRADGAADIAQGAHGHGRLAAPRAIPVGDLDSRPDSLQPVDLVGAESHRSLEGLVQDLVVVAADGLGLGRHDGPF